MKGDVFRYTDEEPIYGRRVRIPRFDNLVHLVTPIM